MTARAVTWNLEWANPGGHAGRGIVDVLRAVQPDVAVLTEACDGADPGGGHVVNGGDDWGYPREDDRRKVRLWSRQPWSDIDSIGHVDLPPGRFIAATTETGLGAVRVVGVCIPFANAHAGGGQRNRRRWEDHRRYLELLPAVLAEQAPLPTVVAGDFNQRIPRPTNYVPQELSGLLLTGVADYRLLTSGLVDGFDGQLIDHIAISPQLRCGNVRAWPGDRDGKKLSDHAGVAADLELA